MLMFQHFPALCASTTPGAARDAVPIGSKGSCSTLQMVNLC